MDEVAFCERQVVRFQWSMIVQFGVTISPVVDLKPDAPLLGIFTSIGFLLVFPLKFNRDVK